MYKKAVHPIQIISIRQRKHNQDTNSTSPIAHQPNLPPAQPSTCSTVHQNQANIMHFSTIALGALAIFTTSVVAVPTPTQEKRSTATPDFSQCTSTANSIQSDLSSCSSSNVKTVGPVSLLSPADTTSHTGHVQEILTSLNR